MVDTWSSMDSSNSPLTDSGPSASDDCTPSTSSDVPRASVDAFSPVSPHARRLPDTKGANKSKTVNAKPLAPADKARARDLTLDLETPEPALPRRPHFLDEDYQPPSRSNIECRIPKPHFLDHSPSPDEFDERSDITNPNFLDDDILEADDQQAQRKSGALPKRPQKTPTPQDERPRTNYRSTLHYGLESAARSSERDKRASQLYRGTWPGERDVWNGQETASVRSFSSNGSADNPRSSSNLENKMDTVYSLLSLLTLSPDSNADLSGPLLEMSRSVESCIAMRQAGCIPLLVQLIHSKLARETRDRAAKALRNIIHTQTDDKAGRREARVWRLLEQVREYCYVLEDLIEARKDGKEVIDDDAAKHPSQSVAALMKLSFDEEHRHVVCQLGGLQTLAALVSGDQLAHGSRTDDNTCLTMRKYAGMTLTNLTFGDGNNKSLLCSFKDFMMALVEQLESPNDDMRQVTAAVLRNLSWRADTNSKQVLREVDAVKGLTKAAMTCQKEATLKSVLSALWNLTAHCSMNKVALCSVDGALGFLVDMLSYNSPTKSLAIVENAGGIVRNVSSHIAVREDYRHILRERNCLSVLLQHLKSPSLTVVSNSCGTLWNLSARCPEDQQFLWDHAAVPMLRSLIHSKHKMIAMGSGAALKNLLNSKPGKTHIVTMDPTARNMNLPALPTLGARKQKALDQELDQNLAETCDNIEPATSPTTSNREEKNLFTATERQLALNLERHRMTSSSPLMGALTSQISLSHSAHLASYLSCSNTLLKGALVSRNSAGGSSNNVNRSDSKDSVTSTHSDSIFERTTRTGKVPVPTPRNKDLMKTEPGSDFKMPITNDGAFAHARYPLQPPIPPPRSSTELRTNYPEPGYDVDQDSCDQPVDYSMKYSETKSTETLAETSKPKSESSKKTKKDSGSYGDYQETDLDQPTDYSLRCAELQSETGSDSSEPAGPAADEDTIKHFATEGTPYETPIIFSTATSMSDLRVIGKSKVAANVKENPEIMTHSDEKDTCSIEDPRPDNDRALARPLRPVPEKRGVFDTKFSSGLASPEKPVRYCDEGTPGCFSRVSSLSSLGEPAEELSLAKRNARATINPETDLQDQASGTKDKEGSKAVTFASEPVASSTAATPALTSSHQSVQQTPLMFSRSSSLGSLGTCEPPSQPASVMSEVSRLTSGCISPSEIPDSPGQSAPLSPRAPPRDASAPATPPPVGLRSVFEERATTFLVENTPAHFSTATSLSSLTIDDHEDAKLDQVLEDPSQDDDAEPSYDSNNTNRARAHDAAVEFAPLRGHIKDARSAGGDSCTVYLTEDTPAVLSHTGSQSNLSVLSINSEAPHLEVGAADTSDSSNLSDAADLLEECIQKGIAKVVKNNGPPSDAGSVGQYMARDGPYRSLPPYLRSSTETVKMSHEFSRNVRDSRTPSSERPLSAEGSPPPPLPPKVSCAPAPPRPPPMEPARDDGRKHESRLPIKTQRNLREKPKLAVTSNLARNDSLSSLSLDSFGSTDREIFEETVKAGLSSVQPRKQPPKTKAHSVERPSEIYRPARPIHKSLDRSDKIAQHRPKPFEFEKNLASNRHTKKRSETEFASHSMTRTPYSYHGDTASSSLAYYTRSKPHNSRYYDDGPPSLPARIDAPRHLERSSSLSSLSNDSFGSTDKEVFERSVRLGMSRGQPKKRDDGKLRVRSDDRLEIREPHRARRRRNEGHNLGALDKMVGEEYSKDRAILEEVIARGAGETKPNMPPNVPPKNVPAPSAARARADGSAARAPPATRTTGCDETLHDSAFDTSLELNSAQKDSEISNAYRSMDSGNITYTSTDVMGSNECLAPKSANTTLESDAKDELNRSNESYAEVLDESWSEPELPPNNCDAATLTRDKSKQKLEWTDIKNPERPADFDDSSKRSTDTWNDNTCPDDVTFPTISGSVHLVSSIRSEVVDAGHALPDLLEKAGLVSMSFSRPDLTNKLDGPEASTPNIQSDNEDKFFLDGVPEPSFASIVDDGEHKFDSFLASEIEQEAARLAAQLKTAQFGMENSVTSLNSLDLDNIRPPSNLGSLLSLSASGQFEDTNQTSKKCNSKSRKKSLPVALMVKRALSNSMHQGSSEHLDSNPTSILDNIKPPSEMDIIDLESSMVSVASIASEVVDVRRTPVVFDFKQPIQDFPLCNNFVFHDLDKINPPSLFDEMAESTMEIEQTTAQQILDDCVSNTLNVVTDIPSGSEDCTPLPSDISSVESTPKKHQNNRYLTPKEKRLASKDRYQTYTITDTVTECDVVLKVDTEEFLTWTKSESDSRSDEYVTANSEGKSKRRLSAKQRRMEDRARYQTQTVDLNTILTQASNSKVDSHIESLKQRLAAKKTMKQKRMEDAERFRTRTLSEDIPPSPTFVTKDANFENIETTTGYDSLSSNELNHQQIIDERLADDVFSRDGDSGHNDDEFELNSTQMQTYTKSFRSFLPAVASPAAMDLCIINNLKNIEMTASYQRALQNEVKNNPSSSDFASYEGDSNSEDKVHSDSEPEACSSRPKPKIIKPVRRDESLDSNESQETEQEAPKGVRGRKKAAYVSPYRRNIPSAKKTTTVSPAPKTTVKMLSVKVPATPVKPQTSVRTPNRTPCTSKATSASTSPKKTPLGKSLTVAQKPHPNTVPLSAVKPLPLERQGTFTKEDSVVPARDLPMPDKVTSQLAKAATPTKPTTTSPSRLPQMNRYNRPQIRKTNSVEKPTPKRANTRSAPTMRNSASNHSLQSNDSGKTVTLASRSSRQGSTSSVNSIPSAKANTKDIESKIAGLWKKVEQTKKQTGKPDRRVWIEPKVEPPKLIRSSTFEGQPKQNVSTAPKQKTSIGIRTTQIPSLRPKAPSKAQAPATQIPSVSKKPTNARALARRPVNS